MCMTRPKCSYNIGKKNALLEKSIPISSKNRAENECNSKNN